MKYKIRVVTETHTGNLPISSDDPEYITWLFLRLRDTYKNNVVLHFVREQDGVDTVLLIARVLVQ